MTHTTEFSLTEKELGDVLLLLLLFIPKELHGKTPHLGQRKIPCTEMKLGKLNLNDTTFDTYPNHAPNPKFHCFLCNLFSLFSLFSL